MDRCSFVIVGKGHWGSALGKVLRGNGHKVSFLTRGDGGNAWSARLNDRPFVLLATPFSEISKVLQQLSHFKIAGLINASKGIDRQTLATFSNLAKGLIKAPVATLSGPTFAREVSRGKPTACVLGGRRKNFLTKVSQLMSSRRFRVYISSDPVGVEACGAIKNVLAVACGISDGMGFGLNARAALLTRGLVEMLELIKILGGNPKTAFGLAGVGDLWLTATGDLSRNRQLGLLLVKGVSVRTALSKLKGPAEGLYTVSQVVRLAKRKGVELPICEQVDAICRGRRKPIEALDRLMTRELKTEESNWKSIR